MRNLLKLTVLLLVPFSAISGNGNNQPAFDIVKASTVCVRNGERQKSERLSSSTQGSSIYIRKVSSAHYSARNFEGKEIQNIFNSPCPDDFCTFYQREDGGYAGGDPAVATLLRVGFECYDEVGNNTEWAKTRNNTSR